jgi:hypothetical protein
MRQRDKEIEKRERGKKQEEDPQSGVNELVVVVFDDGIQP